MSLDFAILGFLNYQPYTGYDLKKIFDTSIRHFWQADQSQIYRTLTRLNEQGYVTVERIPQEDKPDRKVYAITQSGRNAFLSWLSGSPPLNESRNAALIQVFFAGQLTNAEILAKFEAFADLLRAFLAQYNQIPQQVLPFQKEINSAREYYFWMSTLDNGIRCMHASLEWAESVIADLKAGKVPA